MTSSYLLGHQCCRSILYVEWRHSKWPTISMYPVALGVLNSNALWLGGLTWRVPVNSHQPTERAVLRIPGMIYWAVYQVMGSMQNDEWMSVFSRLIVISSTMFGLNGIRLISTSYFISRICHCIPLSKSPLILNHNEPFTIVISSWGFVHTYFVTLILMELTDKEVACFKR